MRQEKLSSLLDISIGRTPSRSKSDYWGEGYPWVSIRDLNSKTITETKEQITEIGVKEARCKIVKKGTLLFSFKLTIGKMAFTGCDLFTNEAIAAFAIKDEKELNPEYLYYALQSATYGGSNQAVMGKTLNSKSLAEIKIPLPPINDQLRIANLLGKVEGLIAQRKQHLQQLDDLLKSVFLDMFGDPVRNEKGWKVDLISRSIKVQGGFAFKSKDITSSGAIKLVKISNVHFENLTWDDVSYVPASFIEAHKRFSLQEGDLLVALTRPVIKSLNVVKMATVRKEDLPCLLNQRVARFLIDQNQINKRFFLQYCYTEFFRNTVEGLCPPGLQPNVSTNQIEDIQLFYPPIDLQNEFAAIADKVEALKSRYQQSLTDLESLYGALSQQVFKGDLDLSQVPLSDSSTDAQNDSEVMGEVATAIPEPEAAGNTMAIHLPESDGLPDALTDKAKRNELFAFWLESYCQQIGHAPFSASDFLAAAQTRIAELHPDNEFELGLEDYEQIKHWAFEALNSGRLQQAQNVTGQDENGDPILGNKIELKAGIKP